MTTVPGTTTAAQSKTFPPSYSPVRSGSVVSVSVGLEKVSALPRHGGPTARALGAGRGPGPAVSSETRSGWEVTCPPYWGAAGWNWIGTLLTSASTGARRTLGVSGIPMMKGGGQNL